jgi:hypothetical protein
MTGSKREDGGDCLPGLKTRIAVQATREIKGTQQIETGFYAYFGHSVCIGRSRFYPRTSGHRK